MSFATPCGAAVPAWKCADFLAYDKDGKKKVTHHVIIFAVVHQAPE
jgi:hypothetical protein